MCGRTASLSTLPAAWSTLSSDAQDGIVQGFGVVPQDTIPEGRRVVPTSDPWRVAKGSDRAEAVANHLRVQHRELVDRLLGWPSRMEAATYQAGAAATEAMADLLDALVAGDTRSARAVIERFVNEAVTSGAVTLPTDVPNADTIIIRGGKQIIDNGDGTVTERPL